MDPLGLAFAAQDRFIEMEDGLGLEVAAKVRVKGFQPTGELVERVIQGAFTDPMTREIRDQVHRPFGRNKLTDIGIVPP